MALGVDVGVDGRRDVLGHVGVLEEIGELWPKATVQLAWCTWSAPVCGMRPRSTGGRSAGAAGGLHPDRVAELAVPAGMPTPRALPRRAARAQVLYLVVATPRKNRVT